MKDSNLWQVGERQGPISSWKCVRQPDCRPPARQQQAGSRVPTRGRAAVGQGIYSTGRSPFSFYLRYFFTLRATKLSRKFVNFWRKTPVLSDQPTVLPACFAGQHTPGCTRSSPPGKVASTQPHGRRRSGWASFIAASLLVGVICDCMMRD